jgi:hypothetical protein
MKSQGNAFVLSIRFDNQTTYELKEILHAIGAEVISGLTWGVEGLDWLGPEDVTRFNDELDAAPGGRMLISGRRLLELADQVWQTIEGEFIGYGTSLDAREFLETGSPLAWFITSPAEIAIEVQDGQFFDVYLRSQTFADRLAQHFRDVGRQERAGSGAPSAG